MRIILNVALAISILYAPWWAPAIILLVACLLVERFYEAVVWGIVVDALYGTDLGYKGFSYVATLYAAVALILSTVIRKRVVW